MTPWRAARPHLFVIESLTIWNENARNINFAVDFVSEV
jgi:hypothetical protein